MKDIVNEFIEKAFKNVMRDMDVSVIEMRKAKERHRQFEMEFAEEFKEAEQRIGKIRKEIQHLK